MRLSRALLALAASTLFVVILTELNRYTYNPEDYFEVDLSLRFVGQMLFYNFVPILCWLVVLLPLLFFTRCLDRWPWYWLGLCGLVIGAGVATAFLFTPVFVRISTRLEVIIITVWGLAAAIQFIVVSLTKRWSKKAAVPDPVETASTAQS
jgi:hypothetical protein